MFFKSSRLVTCSFPSDTQRRSSRTMFSNSFSFTVTSLLKNVSFSWKSCYPQHIRICCMPFLHVAICLRCFTCIFIQTKNPSCMLSLSTSLYNEALSISLTKSFKRSRPMSLWDLNPLDLTYQVNSFTISELLLRVFQNQWSPGWDSNSRPLVPWKGLEDLNFYIKDINCLWVHCLMLSP